MKLITPKIELLKQGTGLDGIYKQIELAGRTCYKSEDRITEGSAKKFVDMMIKSGHGAMLEHGTVYLYFPMLSNENHLYHKAEEYYKNPYSKVKIAFEENGQPIHANNGYYITTNLRVLVENGWLDDLKYICEPTKYHERRVTIKFTCGIDITREFNRHRVNSMAEQSTRYCNYTKDKFGNEIGVMLPQEFNTDQITNSVNSFSSYYWSDTCNEFCESHAFRGMCKALSQGSDDDFNIIDTWLFAHLACEWSYFRLINLGWKPQMARKVLNLDTASELVHTAFISDWKHFLSLRSPKYGATGMHPDAAILADMVYEEFSELELF